MHLTSSGIIVPAPVSDSNPGETDRQKLELAAAYCLAPEPVRAAACHPGGCGTCSSPTGSTGTMGARPPAG